MALQHIKSLDSGIVCAAAYTRIAHIRYTHTDMEVITQTWADATCRQQDKATIANQVHALPWMETVTLSAAYTALKTFPEFAGALDV